MSPVDAEAFARAQSGDHDARDRIFNENVGLIWACVRRYTGLLEKDDLFQMGSIGLLSAINRFDPTYGVAFSTFAVPHIIGEVRRHLRDNALVKVDRRLKEIAFHAGKVRQRKVAETGEEPSVSEIATELGVPSDMVVQAMEASASVVYLEDVPGYSEGRTQGEDRGSERASPMAPDESADLKEALSRLEPDMRVIVNGRFFMGKTQSEISSELGISQAHVSRLEKKALTAIREYYRGT